MPTDMQILKRIYNAFDPARPLSAGDTAYVECRDVRGDRDILQEAATEILRSDNPTCQLYAGHRGAGKSTELLRLKAHLQENNYKVVYFAADEEDIDSEDARYTDILLACTRRLLQALGDDNPDNAVMKWLQSRWESLKNLAATEPKLENISIGAFAKITANLRAVPSLRHEIRKQVEPHTVTLLQALNELIDKAAAKLPPDTGIVLIVDNLDRIVPVVNPDSKRLNHDEIFLDRSEQLRALHCHVVYTVPISLVYSQSGINLDTYGSVEVLPMVKVCKYETQQRIPGQRPMHPPGIEEFKLLVKKRLEQVDAGLSLEQVFEDFEVLEKLCLMSGGHMRNLVLLLRTSIVRSTSLPVPARAMLRAMSEMRETYRRTIAEDEWDKLVQVYRTCNMSNKDDYRQLLFNRCICEYRQIDDQQNVKTWYDVHPLIEDIDQFKQAYETAASPA
ncbi:MAG: ATP-binding protein [Gammaproteobacteria bacterium]|nr:ATP-binding protein [Gammaproteobacteria bacterium]